MKYGKSHGNNGNIKKIGPPTESNPGPILRTTRGLRDALFEEMDLLRAGKTAPARARAMSMLARGVLESVNMEVEVHKYVADLKKIGDEAEIIGTLLLGEQNDEENAKPT